MRCALVGNPNSGKTTLFNTLTGSSARVGNWPGVTVDKKEGIYRFKLAATTEKINIIDLPGIYSLSPYTPEEVIARQFIIEEKPEIIINIVDATNLERNLYLTTQLLELDIPIVIALNMMDIIEREGSMIEVSALSRKLGVPVIPISALRAGNIKTLIEEAVLFAQTPRKGTTFLPNIPAPGGRRQLATAGLYKYALDLVQSYNINHPVFHTIKLIENDAIELQHDSSLTAAIQSIKPKYERAMSTLPMPTGAGSDDSGQHLSFDYEAEIADLRYKFITQSVKPAVVKLHKNRGMHQSEKIDNVLTHRIWGLPIFLLVIFAAFHFIFAEDLLFLKRLGVLSESIPSLGVLLQGYTEDFQQFATTTIGAFLQSVHTSAWAVGLIVNGLLTGVCTVLTFLPQILLLFLFLSILEDTGYMSRVAFLMDRPLRRFGLSGKAFLPMLMGFGCSVPAMMGTRTLDNVNEKRLTLMLIPFFSCGAKLAIWSIIVATVFPANADFVVFGIYVIGIVVAVFAALILKKLVFKESKSNFVLELPVYRLPRVRNTALYLWDKLRGFLITVTTIVAAATIVIWFLQNFNFHLEMLAPGDNANSILGRMGTALQGFFVPLGFGRGPESWKLVVAILTGLVAKELVVATMGVLYIPGFSEDTLSTANGENSLMMALSTLSVFTPLTAMSFMIFNLLSVPCFASVATVFAELKSAKWTLFTLLFWLCTAWTVSFLVFQIGSLFLGANPATVVIALLAIVILVGSIAHAIAHRKRKKTCATCGGCAKCN